MFYLLIDITANMTFPIHSVQTTTPTGHMQFLHFSWAAARTIGSRHIITVGWIGNKWTVLFRRVVTH